MRTSKRFTAARQGGFALLLTLIVISVVLAVGLSLLNITLKQFTLSVTGRESEEAFHSAHSGIECMHFSRLAQEAAFLAGGSVSLTCAGVTDAPTRTASNVGDAIVRKYSYEFDETGQNEACLQTDMYILDLRNSDDPLDGYLISGEGLEELNCAAGVVCTTIFSRGYNRSCNNLSSIQTVQRELTLQF